MTSVGTMRHQGLLRPDAFVSSVCEVTPKWLSERKLEAVLVDLDNTITVWRSGVVGQQVREWLADLRGADIPVCIISNSRRPARVRALAADLGLPFIAWAGKPRRRGFRRALAMIGRDSPAGVAMLGDQLFTDVLGARRAQLYAVLVDPLSSYEFVGTRLIRGLESWLVARYRAEAVR